MNPRLFLPLLSLCACATFSPGEHAVRQSDPYVVANGKMRVRILVESTLAAPTLASMSYLDGDADVVVPEHTHAGAAEMLFIHDGEGRMSIGGQERDVHPGDAIYIPPDTPHSFHGAGTRPLRALQIYTPPGAEQRFRTGAAPAAAQ